MDHNQQDEERIRKIVLRAHMMQAKRSMITITVLLILFFAVQGIAAIYRFFS